MILRKRFKQGAITYRNTKGGKLYGPWINFNNYKKNYFFGEKIIYSTDGYARTEYTYNYGYKYVHSYFLNGELIKK